MRLPNNTKRTICFANTRRGELTGLHKTWVAAAAAAREAERLAIIMRDQEHKVWERVSSDQSRVNRCERWIMNEWKRGEKWRARAHKPSRDCGIYTEKAKTCKHKRFRVTLGGLCRAVTVASAVFGGKAVTFTLGTERDKNCHRRFWNFDKALLTLTKSEEWKVSYNGITVFSTQLKINLHTQTKSKICTLIVFCSGIIRSGKQKLMNSRSWILALCIMIILPIV